MRILFVSNIYPMGFEREEERTSFVFYNFVKSWENMGHNVDVIRPNIIILDIIKNRKIYANGIYEQQGRLIFNLNYITPFWFNIYEKFEEEFEVKQYDLIIAHGCNGIFFCEKLLRHKFVPIIYGVHCEQVNICESLFYKFYLRSRLKSALRRSRLLAVMNPSLIKRLKKVMPNWKNKMFLSYSGIERGLIQSEYFMNRKIENFRNKKKIKIVTVSKFDRDKNLDVLIKSVERVDIVDWELQIIGGYGSERGNIEKLIEKLGLSHKVRLCGFISHDQVMQKLQESDIFVLLSRNQTFLTVYLEAMASGCITIGAKNEGIDNIIINNQNGFICDICEKELTQLLNRIIRTEAKVLKNIIQNMRKTILKCTNEKAGLNYSENMCKVVEDESIFYRK